MSVIKMCKSFLFSIPFKILSSTTVSLINLSPFLKLFSTCLTCFTKVFPFIHFSVCTICTYIYEDSIITFTLLSIIMRAYEKKGEGKGVQINVNARILF